MDPYIHPDIKPGTLHFTLESLYRQYQTDYLDLDPLGLVRRYPDPRDQEIAGFIAAGLAIGQADLIRQSVEWILDQMIPSPYQFVISFHPDVEKNPFKGFVYRFYRDRDIALLIWWIAQMIRQSGSIHEFFLQGYSSVDPHIGPSLSRFVQSVLLLESRPFYPETPAKGSGIRHFLADPQDGSGCKRLNLFLRWMVRKDTLDLGLWPEVSPSQLVIPLDIHISRLGRYLGFTGRISPGWNMALEITESLRQFDPDDPVKYDFALCTLGKLGDCSDSKGRANCAACPVVQFCQANIYL